MGYIMGLGGGGMDQWAPGIRMLRSIRPRWAMGLCVGNIIECRAIEVGKVHGARFRQTIIIGDGQIIEMQGVRCTKPRALIIL